MNRSPSSPSPGRLPFPGSPASSWAMYQARFKAIFQGADASVLVAFWLFGLINNVLYVIILSAALDLVGPDVPKGVVLLADVAPSFLTKLVAPYFIHKVPYRVRILILCALSSSGMFLIALTPSTQSGGSITAKLLGVVMASLSSGAGELSFLGLTHYYGPFSLAAWGSGTGGAGLAGAGLYVLLTTTFDLSVSTSLLTSAFLPVIMLGSFFLILPHGPLRHASNSKQYQNIPTIDIDTGDNEEVDVAASPSLLAPDPASYLIRPRTYTPSSTTSNKPTFLGQLRRARSLFVPYMVPLLLVYIAEYTINQGVSPTLLFPLPSSPFSAYRSFYPFYNFLYQIGVFIARSSTPFYRIHNLYLPSTLQSVNLLILISQALYDWIPSIYIVFLIIFWEGLLGGAVYVNTFAEIMDNIPETEREFSLGATSVSDSAGICIAGFLGMALEVWLCNWQVKRGRNWCKLL